MSCRTLVGVAFLSVAILLCSREFAAGDVIIAEGEQFKPADKNGWQVTHQDDSYGSHSYGGMWMTHGGCLGAPASSWSTSLS